MSCKNGPGHEMEVLLSVTLLAAVTLSLTRMSCKQLG